MFYGFSKGWHWEHIIPSQFLTDALEVLNIFFNFKGPLQSDYCWTRAGTNLRHYKQCDHINRKILEKEQHFVKYLSSFYVGKIVDYLNLLYCFKILNVIWKVYFQILKLFFKYLAQYQLLSVPSNVRFFFLKIMKIYLQSIILQEKLNSLAILTKP